MAPHLQDTVRWLYWHPFKRIVQSLPVDLVYSLGRFASALLYHASPRKRRALEDASRIILGPAASAAELDRTARRTLFIFACNELEVLLFPKLNPDVMAKIVEYEGLDFVAEGLRAGKGVMLVFGHFGANQMIMPAIGYRGYTMYQMSAPATVLKEKLPGSRSAIGDKVLDLRWEHELSLPVQHINIFGSLKEAFTCLHKNHVLGIACDGGGGREKTTVDFFGRKVDFATGAMSIAARTGCAVVPTFMIRRPDGHHRLVMTKPMTLITSGTKDECLQRNMQAFVAILEDYVRRYPCHYAGFLAFRIMMAAHGKGDFFSGEPSVNPAR